ncbi:MAG: hypothetical protein A2845_01525 [Candidatus Lloydbacteria bacterium RIFCSPHIGHO2_01_FULL_49_22]|uniref:Uncharacterized protein n=1 Tax=Candidatus Lloydbacteria bacterium RIFCSPHIGHO2_01_FULL_49_22 TaxID=1798658 RepID=A0A1G2CXH6_9BACT|nr:MAG: hypothetical protein A2845_01525 [Candidatus Lloydbacteria bacterium RIFCSPHIGHO2_01_FULL_49_22]OGZ09977.1 MAG: hypothetical protein A3C14_04690 [Candidatus Lloydbacteria bacterium RIFCSPHIGHO2_02_FULL_50_18]
MIAKPEWFKRRKYTGWGLTPSTWQGWAYIVVMILPIIVITEMNVIGSTQVVLLSLWAIVFGIDFIAMMVHVPKDERDIIHEAISERNALWAILVVLTAGIGYQIAAGIVVNEITRVDPVILLALIVGTIVKAASNFYLDKKN